MQKRYIEKKFTFPADLDLSAFHKICMDRPLGDELKIFPHPLILSQTEYDTLRANSKQRHLAMQAFFEDVIIGSGKIFSKKFESGFSQEIVEKTFCGNGKTTEQVKNIWKNRSSSDILAWSGGDLVRDPSGQWLVIEDNLGNIEGRVSTPFAHEHFFAKLGQENPYSQNDLQTSIGLFLDRANQTTFAITSKDGTRFKGNSRTAEVLSHFNIEKIHWESIDSVFEQKIIDNEINGVLNFNTGSWPGGKKKLSHIFRDSTSLFFEAPYFKVVCDKALLQFMPDLIRFYLGEKPLLSSPETHFLTDLKLIDGDKNWVIKVTNGHSGDGVFILDEMTDSEISDLQEQLNKWSQLPKEHQPMVIQQERIFPSVIQLEDAGKTEDYQVELRVPAYSYDWQKIHVSEQITARGIPLSTGDSRCHVLRGACSVPVVIES